MKRREISVKNLRKYAKMASTEAINENKALGLPIVIAKNNIIVRRYPDGREEKVGETEFKRVKVKTHVFKVNKK